ncbi:MAG: nucleoside diphosphate kinase regulator [Marinobacter sp.]|nr:nucleoside diphosphate kinase regulator [Marinobacter sp.]
MSQPSILVSKTDYERLCAMLDSLPSSPATEGLLDELDRARIVAPEDMPADVVTMRSTVTFTLPDSGKSFTYTLVYPREMGDGEGKLSILTPVGTALLGLSVGQSIDWPTGPGKTTQVHIDRIDYQPENAGDLSR